MSQRPKPKFNRKPAGGSARRGSIGGNSSGSNATFRNFWLPTLVLAGLTLLVYAPALGGGFVWDDDMMVTDNAVVQSATGLADIWFSTRLPDFFPLTWTSLWLEWRCWGMNAAGYHVTNVLLHLGSAWLWWRLLRLLAVPGAWLIALLFAVHPVNVESVAWIAERKNTLAMFFFTLALWGYQRFEAKEQIATPSRPDKRWYVFSLLAFLLALLSKTAVVGLPIVLLLGAWWRRGKASRRDLLRTAPFFALALLLGLVTIWFEYHSARAAEGVATQSWPARFAGAGTAVWFYLGKALWPVKLIFVYPAWHLRTDAVRSYLPLAAMVAVLGAGWYGRRRWGKPLLVALGYFAVMLFPVLGFFKIYFQRYAPVADHWQYFAIIGIIALGVGAGKWLCERWGQPGVGRSVAAVVVAAFCFLSSCHAGRFKNPEVLWRDTLAKNPGCWMAWNDLGFHYKNQRRFAEAESSYHEALKLNPDYFEAYHNLGLLLADTGRDDAAVEPYRRALALRPDYVEAQSNLGAALGRLGRIDEAIVCFQAALRLAPHYALAQENLAAAFSASGDQSALIDHYQQALRLAPNEAGLHFQLAMLFTAANRRTDAEREYQETLRLDPNFTEAGEKLKMLGNPQ